MFSYYSNHIILSRLLCLMILAHLQGTYARVSSQWSSPVKRLFTTHSPLRCFSCTTLDANEPLNDVQDVNWRRWIESFRYVSRTPDCANPSEHSRMTPPLWGGSRRGVRTAQCDGGMCLKMWYRDAEGDREHAWRSCIVNSARFLEPECTRIIGSHGQMEVCVCNTSLCNGGDGGGGAVSTSASSALFHNGAGWHLISTVMLTTFIFRYFFIHRNFPIEWSIII